MTPDTLILPGCSPTPLASYLKALGLLRLLSCGTNSVTGEPADSEARGWWQGERFHLRTSLGRDGVVHFFLRDYAPSPVIAPWNKGSGFYPNDNKDGFQLLSARVDNRFQQFSVAIRCAQEILKSLDLDSRSQERKAQLVAMLRARLPAAALPWIDAALVLSVGELRFPPLLGTGGNDGRLDFTNNFMRQLVSKPLGIFDASSGEPSQRAEELFDHALFGQPTNALADAKVGQFSPGRAGGPNATTGYEGSLGVNSWDYVLMLEGASTFSSAATRRYQSDSFLRYSAPFTVGASGSGWGGVALADESSARGEFWAPLWTRPARFREIKALFAEGRAVSNGKTAKDALEFARALGALGVSRGLSEFQRYGLFQRAGKAHYATALARRPVALSYGTNLVADLDQGDWLSQVRKFGRKNTQPAEVRSAVKNLEDALFELLSPDCPPRSVVAALRAIGRLGRWLSISPHGRKSVSPPPLLSPSWLRRAEDGSSEFAVAAALASLGIPSLSRINSPQGSDSDKPQQQCVRAPPMAAHFAPLTNGPREGFEDMTFFKNDKLSKLRKWACNDRPPTVVWGRGGLVSNMIAVLERRVVEASIRGLVDKPLGSSSYARLSHVADFLTSDFDDARCSELLAGIVWTRPAGYTPARNGDQARSKQVVLPFAYAALKPIFSTNQSLVRVGAIPKDGSIPIPPDLLGRLRAGGACQDGRATGRAVRAAFVRARSSGLPSLHDPMPPHAGVRGGRIGVGIRADRLAAAMLIPISDSELTCLLQRAYLV